MKIFKNKFKALLLSAFLITSFIACDEGGNPDPGATALVNIAGDWTVDILRDGSEFSHGHISTYNTSANIATEFWLDDLESGWGLKSKVNFNESELAFSGENLAELYYDVTVTITDGVFVKNGTTAPSGTVTDSIYFKAVFSDVPTRVFEYYGHKRTGFREDE
ncbi:lipid-binding protein [Thalassobellus citreus]|uniref:lipid-binding protein n=1 Tax=Thalassobellus citreus TaxID=3367752 RepID=UPI0037A08B68